MDRSVEMQIFKFYLFCQPAGLLHGTILTPLSKPSGVGEPRHRRWRRKEWKWVRSRHTGRVEFPCEVGRKGVWGGAGAENSFTEPAWSLVPKKRYEVANVFLPGRNLHEVRR